jgi:hypothetical protein
MSKKIWVCSSILKPKNIIKSSASDLTQVYIVSLSTPFNDAACTCKGFTFKGVCKHISEEESQRCSFADRDNGNTYSSCPKCGGEVELYDPEVNYE